MCVLSHHIPQEFGGLRRAFGGNQGARQVVHCGGEVRVRVAEELGVNLDRFALKLFGPRKLAGLLVGSIVAARPETTNGLGPRERTLAARLATNGEAEYAEIATKRRRARLHEPALAADSSADDRDYVHRCEAERAAAVPTIGALLERVRALPAEARGSRAVRRRERLAIACDWNATICERGWDTLPTLCESCGVPVLMRQPERHSIDNIERSTVCSSRCQSARKSRLHATKTRQARRNVDS